jgi:hypothetical protein
MKIETILLACDDSPKFLGFLPSAAYHWKSMGYRVAFGLVTRDPLSSDREAELRTHCDDLYVYVVPEGCPYSVVAMSKLFRFYLARYYPSSVVCVQDIDYYVLDKHAHIETLVRAPSAEVLTYGYNAYYKTFRSESRVIPGVQYAVVPGLPPTAMVYGRDGQLYLNGLGTGRFIQTKLYTPAAIQVPATPTVATGELVYRMLASPATASFPEVLEGLHRATQSLSAASSNWNPPDLTSPDFSDESLFYHLNAINGVSYRHVAREDFVDGTAGRRIDPRRSETPEAWFPNVGGRSLEELLKAGYFLDIQPKRPLEDTPVMRQVFTALQLPLSLIPGYTPNEPVHGSDRTDDVSALS